MKPSPLGSSAELCLEKVKPSYTVLSSYDISTSCPSIVNVIDR